MNDPLRHLPDEVRDAILRTYYYGLPMGQSEAAHYVDKYPDLAISLMHASDELDDDGFKDRVDYYKRTQQ